VLSGYDGSNPLPNPTALFYSIVRRFSPATIAGLFWGHTHEDQLIIYYDYLASSLNTTTGLRNTTAVDYTSPLNVAFIGPSIVPITNNNAGWRIYQVDAKTFNVLGHQTYFANISNSPYWSTPVWEFEYDARTIYDPLHKWGANEPLNATFWHNVTTEMLSNGTLVSIYNFFETKVQFCFLRNIPPKFMRCGG
jgi:sphingomyelin phosphodiesterase